MAGDGNGSDILSMERFSVSLHGKGTGMADLVLTDGCQRLPNATWYDRSPRTLALIAREIAFQRSEHVSPETRERAKKAQANFHNPKPTDVQVTFSGSGRIGDDTAQKGLIQIVGRRGKRNLSYEYNPETWEYFERTIESALCAILRVR